MKNKTYIVTINYYNKKHEYRKMLTSYINPSTELTRAYILNMLPTINKEDIYLLESIDVELLEDTAA